MSRTLLWLPSTTHRSDSTYFRTASRNSSVGRSVQSGPQNTTSSSTCGESSASAIRRASVVLPEQLVPMTMTRSMSRQIPPNGPAGIRGDWLTNRVSAASVKAGAAQHHHDDAYESQ